MSSKPSQDAVYGRLGSLCGEIKGDWLVRARRGSITSGVLWRR
jgi:hypothetical protein